MPDRRQQLEYLRTTGPQAAENMELAALASVSNLRKDLAELLERWVEACARLEIARMVRQENRTWRKLK